MNPRVNNRVLIAIVGIVLVATGVVVGGGLLWQHFHNKSLSVKAAMPPATVTLDTQTVDHPTDDSNSRKRPVANSSKISDTVQPPQPLGLNPAPSASAMTSPAPATHYVSPPLSISILLRICVLFTAVILVLIIWRFWLDGNRTQETMSHIDAILRELSNSHEALRENRAQFKTLEVKNEGQVHGLYEQIGSLKQMIAGAIQEGNGNERFAEVAHQYSTPIGDRPKGATSEEIKQLLEPLNNRLAVDLSGQMQNILRTLTVLRQQIAPEEGTAAMALRDLLARAPDGSDPLVTFGKRLQSVLDRVSPAVLKDDRFLDDLADAVFEPLIVPLAPADQSSQQAQYRVQLLPAIERARSQAADKARNLPIEMIPVIKRQTLYDPNLHTAMRGAETPTDRADLNSKIAESVRAGFQIPTPQGPRVIRKAEVRLFRYEVPEQSQPKPVATPALSAPESVAIQAIPVAEIVPASETPAPADVPLVSDMAPSAEVPLPLPKADDTISNAPQPDVLEPDVLKRIYHAAEHQDTLQLEEWELLTKDLTEFSQSQPLESVVLKDLMRQRFVENVQLIIPKIGDPPHKCKIEGERDGTINEILCFGLILPNGHRILPRVRLSRNPIAPQNEGQEMAE